MTDRSQYLAQALQAIGGSQQPPQGMLSAPQMQQIAAQRHAFEAQNPGQSYAAHGLQQLGQSLMGAPAAIAAAPGNVASGLANFARGLPGMGQNTSQQSPAYPPAPRGPNGEPLLFDVTGGQSGPQPLPNATLPQNPQAVTVPPMANPQLNPDGTPVAPIVLPNARLAR
jgi:hypothetical protein